MRRCAYGRGWSLGCQLYMNVFILASCRNLDLLPASTLVARSLRIGFPTANIFVHRNTDIKKADDLIWRAFSGPGINQAPAVQTIHHAWIEKLIACENEPFFICDTDVVFWDSVETLEVSGEALAGRLIPQFFDRFTNCITRPRLHTSLLYINPSEVRARVKAYYDQFPQTPFNPKANLIYPIFLPVRHGGTVTSYFFDTCSLLYQAIGGRAFTENELDRYDHLHFGTLRDLVAPHYPEQRFDEVHEAVFTKPELLRGAWKLDERFYEANAR